MTSSRRKACIEGRYVHKEGRRREEREKKGEKIDLQKIIIMKQLRFRSTSLARGIGEILTS